MVTASGLAGVGGARRPTSYLTSTVALTKRWVLKLAHEPSGIVAAVLQPAVWLVLFGNAFGGLKPAGAQSYIGFMTAGVVTMTVFNGALAGGIEILFDREAGTLARLLSAPIHQSSIVVSRILAVLILSAIQSVIIVLVALLVGVSFATGIEGLVLILAIGALFGFGVCSLSMALAFLLKGHGQFFSITGFVGLPLMFASSALAPLSTMPVWLRAGAMANPMTYAIDAVRQLMLHGFTWSTVVATVLVLLAFDAAMATLSALAMRRVVG